MTASPPTERIENSRLVLGLLEAVHKGEAKSQRDLAAGLGVALGLVNAYLSRCVNKGLMKVSQVPARRYAYYLTPKGFAEKSRLTAEYLSTSFSFFRTARNDCAIVFVEAKRRGWQSLALAGASEVAEVAALCGMEAGIAVQAVVDPDYDGERFVGVPIRRDFASLGATLDGIVVTAINDTQAMLTMAVAAKGSERVLIPSLLASRLIDKVGDDE
jgi:DNA-binding MarR family transcriptional regulator